MVDAQALANEFEAAADGERGGSQDDGVELFEKALAQNLADVDGRGGEKHAFVAALVPIDVIFFVGFKEKGDFLAQFETAPRDAQQFFGLLGHGREFGFEAFQRGEQGVVGFAMLLEKSVALVAGKWKTAVARREKSRKTRGFFRECAECGAESPASRA